MGVDRIEVESTDKSAPNPEREEADWRHVQFTRGTIVRSILNIYRPRSRLTWKSIPLNYDFVMTLTTWINQNIV